MSEQNLVQMSGRGSTFSNPFMNTLNTMMNDEADIEARRKKGRRTAVILGVLALGFYFGFIVLNSMVATR